MKWNRETWKFVVQTLLAVLSAIATSLGVSSCMGLML
ncbi:MAG: smalltalk protein [Prevotella sp.]|nr:smalltalk protein [Prevotella sp.]